MKDRKTKTAQHDIDMDRARKIGSIPMKTDKSILPKPQPDKSKHVSVFELQVPRRIKYYQ